MGLIGLTLATSNIAMAQSFMNSDGTVDWKKVDNLTARDRWMEAAYRDTLSDGKKIAEDEAMSAVLKALAAQKAYDESVANFAKKKEEGLSIAEKVKNGLAADVEVEYHQKVNMTTAANFLHDKVRSLCNPVTNECAEKVKQAVLSGELSITQKDIDDRIEYAGKSHLYSSISKEDAEKDQKNLQSTLDADTANELLKELAQSDFNPERPISIDTVDEYANKAVVEYQEKYGTEEDRAAAEIKFWQDAETSLRQDQDVYDANRNVENALTPEMKNTLIGAMGVGSTADINTALNDPAKKQELQSKLDTLSTQYSFPKVDLNTPEGQATLHNIVGTTSAGKMTTLEYRSDGPATIQTTQEKNEADVQKAMDNLNNMFNNRNVINGVDIMGGSYNSTGEYVPPSWAAGAAVIAIGSGSANTGTGSGGSIASGGLGNSTTETGTGSGGSISTGGLGNSTTE